MTRFLIIGGDSLIGSRLKAELIRQGREVVATSRKPEAGESSLFLDLGRPDDFQIPGGFDYAFVLAAATGVTDCQGNQAAAFINTTALPRLMRRLVAQGLTVNFASTHTVFDGQTPAPDETAEPSPANDYARHKVEGERALFKAAGELNGRAAVTRLTRCLGPGRAPIAGWLADWRAGKTVRPFSDLYFSLISARYVVQSLIQLADLGLEGIFHLSGQGRMNFAGLAEALAEGLNLERSLVNPITSRQAGVNVLYAPRHPELGLTETRRRAGLEPQPPEEALEDLIADCRSYLATL